ncbi:hypothetical protein M3B90_09000 [Dermabacter sp. p3-SID358]|uniref:murein biosynthesis integral membrane protein MurJ n=1 Tax=Dermabacter sp. p3-SID358 TaxID=2916114 RepID=UPI0021A3E0D4|nr:lipid II flippase MurJ [Dermabacter sp. p3-SID358]MCT1867664.1 hypothetical protein [Dermabacter sp. p3-SID358]
MTISSRTSSLVRATGLIAGVTVLARLAGFVRYLVFGASVGAGDIGTAYASANLVPSVLFEVAAGGALASMVIPLIAGLLEEPSRDRRGGSRVAFRESASGIVSALLTWSVLLTLVLAALLWFLAPALAQVILGSGALAADVVAIALGTRLMRVFAFQLPFYAVTIVLGAYLQARRKFLWPALAPLVSSAVVMGSYVLYALTIPVGVTPATLSKLSEAALGWGTTLGVVAMALCVLIPAVRSGFIFTPHLALSRGVRTRALGLAGSGLATVGAQQMTTALILALAVRAGGTGTLPLFQYGQAVYLLPYAVLLVPVMTSVFPELSELRARGDRMEFSALTLRSVQTVVAFAAVGGAAIWGAGISIDRFFVAVDRSGIRGVGAVTAALALGLIAYGIVMLTTKVLYAAMRPAEALAIGATGWGIAGVLILVTVLTSPPRITATAGVLFGLCISAGMWIAAIGALNLIRERVMVREHVRPLVTTVLASVVASALGSIAGLGLAQLAGEVLRGAWGALVLGICTGVAGAAVCLCVLMIADRSLAAPILGLFTRLVKSPRKA